LILLWLRLLLGQLAFTLSFAMEVKLQIPKLLHLLVTFY